MIINLIQIRLYLLKCHISKTNNAARGEVFLSFHLEDLLDISNTKDFVRRKNSYFLILRNQQYLVAAFMCKTPESKDSAP